ncbi:hypothetical protein ND486_14885 [Pseudonocardia sp. DR1-2]|uniref:hypothetical protein n=1 Tax=Pseudonocardia sp. DR1-2 TaxID=2951168 RepID=UPI00204471AB|nr:hypothetical protein [Pseudonocardia sp. DR1-2]MCM3847477.1 hypothetical protein [Pseudonocardia sp. DR1-2]
MVEQLNLWVDAVGPVWQFLAVFVIGVVPFLESYTGTLVGTVTGMPVLLAAAGAIAGNVLALVVAVRLGDRARRDSAAARRGRRRNGGRR